MLFSVSIIRRQSRVVVLSSAAERIGNLEFGDLNYKSRSMKTFTIGVLP